MTTFRTLPPFGGNERQVAEVVRGLMDGKSNNTGTVTLNTGGATSTTIYDERIGYESVILFSPLTSNAANSVIPYGSFHDTTDQTAASTTTAYPVTFNTTDDTDGITLASGSRITAAYSGLYNLQFSIQFTNTDTQIGDADVWFRKNGTDIDASNSQFSIPNSHGGIDGHLIASLNFYVELAKNEYVEIIWATNKTQIFIETIAAQTSPTRPVTPGVIATIQYVSSNGYSTNFYSDMFISSQSPGSAVITHASNTLADRTYRYAVIG